MERFTWDDRLSAEIHSPKAVKKNIADFREYAEKRKKREPEWLKPLQSKDLICWCKPSGCHGDVLIELATETSLFAM